METHVENGLVDTVGEGESGISTYILAGIRWRAGEKLLCGTGNPVWCSVMTWRDGMGGEEEG